MQDLSSKHIIPNMEQKIRMLNQQVIYVWPFFLNWCFEFVISDLIFIILTHILIVFCFVFVIFPFV